MAWAFVKVSVEAMSTRVTWILWIIATPSLCAPSLGWKRNHTPPDRDGTRTALKVACRNAAVADHQPAASCIALIDVPSGEGFAGLSFESFVFMGGSLEEA